MDGRGLSGSRASSRGYREAGAARAKLEITRSSLAEYLSADVFRYFSERFPGLENLLTDEEGDEVLVDLENVISKRLAK